MLIIAVPLTYRSFPKPADSSNSTKIAAFSASLDSIIEYLKSNMYQMSGYDRENNLICGERFR